MTETETKSGRSRRGSGNAVPPIERMRAYRARKAAERLAAGLPPPPRPGRPPTKPEKPAVADEGALLARIAELEAKNRMLEDVVEGAQRSITYQRGEIARLEKDLDRQGTSLPSKGKAPAWKHREAALAAWIETDKWHGQEKVRTLRTNITRALSTMEDLRSILQHDRVRLGYDVDALINAQGVLSAFSAGMDNLNSRAATNKFHAEKALKAREMAEREKAAVRLFGTATPTAEAVRTMANEFIAYEKVADAWLAQKHRTKEAYCSIQSTYTLQGLLDKPAALREELLRLATEMPGRGRHRTYDLEAGSCWFGGLEDFEAWRAAK